MIYKLSCSNGHTVKLVVTYFSQNSQWVLIEYVEVDPVKEKESEIPALYHMLKFIAGTPNVKMLSRQINK